MQVILRRLLDASRNAADQELVPTETLKMAAVCYATAPIIVVYPFIQKYFVKGTLAGAVKGLRNLKTRIAILIKKEETPCSNAQIP